MLERVCTFPTPHSLSSVTQPLRASQNHFRFSRLSKFSSVSYFLPSKIMDEAVNVALTTITSILIFTSVVGNSVVCFVVIRNRDMRTPINCLIVNLAVADVVYSLFLIPMVILTHITSHPDGISGKVLCTLLTDGNLAFVGAASSNITLTAIAFERYYAVVYPEGNKGNLNMRKVKLLVLGSWVFAFVLQLPQLLKKEFNRKINPHRCTSTWSEKWVTRGFFLTWLVFFVVCTTLMAGLYSRIVHALWFKRDQDNSATCHQQGVLKVRKRVTLMVVVVTVIFAICWGMDSVMHLIADVISYDIGPLAIPIAHTMIMFNSAVNPFAYALINQRFRQKIMEMFCKRRSKVYQVRNIRPTNKSQKSMEMIAPCTVASDSAEANSIKTSRFGFN
ncbi:QRFP-like peptide receptor isoform X1 [Acropora palmata]|uniref:QRFP-like peptide receptor isoform X1 n=2 Tax=Acropora palmata TaxID=6131 RepID=UPI003D9FB7BA